MAEIPARIDLSKARPVGAFRMMSALRNSEVKQGLGVLLEMTKGLGALRDGGLTEVQERSEQSPSSEEAEG